MLIAGEFILVLFLTIIIETIVAGCFNFRKKVEVVSIVCLNIITNPVFNYLLFIVSYYSLFKVSSGLIWFLELVIVLVEWRMLVFIFQKDVKRFLVMSFVMNFCSVVFGGLIYEMILKMMKIPTPLI